MKTEMVSSLMWVKDSPLNGKEFDTYKVATVANSTSTMHKLASTPINQDCFELNDFNQNIYLNNIDFGLKVV